VYTVTYCKEHGILKEFLENLSPEEVNMVAAECKLEDALRIREEEGIQRGRQEREQEILKLFDTGYSAEEIRERLKTDGTCSNNN
jgi:DNA-binding NarL/FixJ family response regulator